ncbi:PKD domain-containing protein [Burkholderiaceae bacterium DAT-1]|nr:PKD domain-containing protein [Burkholderiaceae bacterium DAT-1]
MLSAVGLSSVSFAAAPEINPESPRYAHPWRHGVVPTLEQHGKMQAWRQLMQSTKGISAAATNSTKTLSFNGGVNGIGVTSGTPKVYLVVYGSQWGAASTDANGNMKLSGDSLGAVPYLQQMFKGLGTNNELWSGVMTQYCDGPLVAKGATTCPSGAPHVGYPTGGALAGIWYDNSVASPFNATADQLAAEAVKAAAHFGNTTAASNRYVQYVILSPTGMHPDGFNTSSGNFCAWHDYTGDTNTSSPYGDIAFTNMPYVADAGSSCGQNYVNKTSGALDGFSLVEGHEYAETVTDQNPAGGWINQISGSSFNGEENADECSWISSGQGASANLTFATGTFAMQSTWSNDTNRCDLTHAIVTGGGSGGGTPVANFTYSATGLSVAFTDSSTDTGGTISARSWNFGDGSTSTATNPSHTYAAAGTYTVSETVTDSVSGTTNTKSQSVTVSSGGGGVTQLLVNPGFESGASGWTQSSTSIIGAATSKAPAHGGTYSAILDGYGSTHTDTLSQTVSIPAGKTSATLTFWLYIATSETTTSSAYDKLTLTGVSGGTTTTLGTYSNLNKGAYKQYSINLNSYIGKTVTLTFTGKEDTTLATSFVLDDLALNVQ